MSYQTGTIAKLNDVLNVLATFLAANGWTIGGNWNEPMYVRTISGDLRWRYGRRIYATKGTMAISAQDFYYTHTVTYGTFSGAGAGATVGPGIAITVGTAVGGVGGGTDAGHPLSGYNLTGPAAFPTFQDILGVPQSASGVTRTFIMPLPDCVSHPMGSYNGGLNDMQPTFAASNPSGDPTLPTFFGPIGGAATPMKYWLIADSAGGNIMMVVDRTGYDLSTICTTPYLYFGDMSAEKGGAWTGGQYLGASLGCNETFLIVAGEFNHVNRFGPPGALRDTGSLTTVLKAQIDGFDGWVGLGNNLGNTVWTGRNFNSTTMLEAKVGDPNSALLGIVNHGALFTTLRSRGSTLANGPVCLPTYWLAQRDNTLWSLLGVLPDVYQAKTKGMYPGKVVLLDDAVTQMIYFDGFAVKVHP